MVEPIWSQFEDFLFGKLLSEQHKASGLKRKRIQG